MKNEVLIIGGGASGLAAGIQAARSGADVTILEHMDRVGKKILSTGNGKCNLSNRVQKPECYRCSQPEFPMQVLEHFGVSQVLMFFESLGLEVKDKNGYLYPLSEQASAVLDVLRMEADHLGIRIAAGRKVKEIRRLAQGGFCIKSVDCLPAPHSTDGFGDEFYGSSLILASGSKAAPASGSDGSGYLLAAGLGHHIINPLPALVQLRCEGNFFKQLAGVRTEVALILKVQKRHGVQTVLAGETGELQLTDYGISGIPVFQISRFASIALASGERVTVCIDFLPQKTREDTRSLLEHRKQQAGYKNAGEYMIGLFNKKLGEVLLKLSGIGIQTSVTDISPAQWEKLYEIMKGLEVVVKASNSFSNAQVCCGGADTREINPDTMESRLIKDFYMTGELLDVDGICGGYNLHWAWATGCIAGYHAGRGNR